MPRRSDLRKILLIGSGPIVIGQASEFDYSGTQACKVLLSEGYEVVLVNSNPATIMTDPDFANATYIEPLTPETLERIIARERPCALLPTIGGQTGLNLAMELGRRGVLARYGVEVIGATEEAIMRAEDREAFREVVARCGLRTAESRLAHSVEQAQEALADIQLPLILRPAFTLGGHGGGVVYTKSQFNEQVRTALEASPIGQVLIEESLEGWGEFELEVMRDGADNVVIVCSIENIDPMGVHTGDSVTVAPIQTLSDRQYQRLRDASLAIIRGVGVETGGSNVQFALNPHTDDLVVIEMNPRVSRSSALASKATGFPIAKIAAKLAVGYNLDEIANDITQKTPACFEPALDYVVVKMPRFAFEKFPGADASLTTQMKSVGETMAIGRTFKEAFQKSLRSRELDVTTPADLSIKELLDRLKIPSADRFDLIFYALEQGISAQQIAGATRIDPWFIGQFAEICRQKDQLARTSLELVEPAQLRRAKATGFSDETLARLWKTSSSDIYMRRSALGVMPVYKAVDTCAAEFEAHTPYFYSSYDEENEAVKGVRDRIVILGSGPNRIGQGIEFDYCCVHGAFTVKEAGLEAIMINCNPETVSTDYDTSTRLYFEPLTEEDVLAVIRVEQPRGVVVQFGGQTPLRLAGALERAGVPVLGTSPQAIDLAEDRERFAALLDRLGLRYPAYGTALTAEQALQAAGSIGFPLLVRPSYVLGGREMRILYSLEELESHLGHLFHAGHVPLSHPLLLDRFLEGAIEVDVDGLCDGSETYIGAIMEHIEEAGIHSGDSACVIPPITLNESVLEQVRETTHTLALALEVVGLINIQFAVKNDEVYILEVNPRASRTVPFVSKATGVPLARMAMRILLGEKIADLGLPAPKKPLHVSVKEAVLPFSRLPGADTVLGPEMKSTGEVMASAADFASAFGKSQIAAGQELPGAGKVFVSVCDPDKPAIAAVGQELVRLGYHLVATKGTAEVFQKCGLAVQTVPKFSETPQGSVVELILRGEISLVINTPRGRGARVDGYEIRRAALKRSLPCITTISGALSALQALSVLEQLQDTPLSLQEIHQGAPSPR